MNPRLWSIAGLLLGAALLVGCVGCAIVVKKKPVLLYSRYFNAIGEPRYQPDGSYKEILNRLGKEFDVRVHSEPLNAKTLAGVSVVLIANPSDQAVGTNPPPHHVDAADIKAITKYVERGGGFVVMGNQENHNLEITDMNRLLGQLCGLQFTNIYTDVKKLAIPKENPIIGGLRWAYYTGNSILMTPNHLARGVRPLVWNDETDPLNGPRNARGPLLAIAERGKGRVVLVTDSGWLNEDALTEKGVAGVAVKGQDNWEICRRLMHWTAGK